MNIFKIIVGLVSFALAVLFCAPLVVVGGGFVFNMYQAGWRMHLLLIPSLEIAGHSFQGWHVWLVAIPFTLIGIAFGIGGYYAFKSGTSAAS